SARALHDERDEHRHDEHGHHDDEWREEHHRRFVHVELRDFECVFHDRAPSLRAAASTAASETVSSSTSASSLPTDAGLSPPSKPYAATSSCSDTAPISRFAASAAARSSALGEPSTTSVASPPTRCRLRTRRPTT